MHKEKKILALIPARGGSKGLVRKNIKPLLSKPLIVWTIEQAKASKYIDNIIVSTDDQEIAEISKKYGAEVPFIRPRELAEDDTRGIDVILHALNWIRDNDRPSDLLALLQTTTPTRMPEDIDASIELLFEKNAQAVVSVCETKEHPYRSNTLPPDGCMRNFKKPEGTNKNRQELPVFYRINGALYLSYRDYFIKQKGFFGRDTFAYIMPEERSIDIDTEYDFKIAEYLLSRKVRLDEQNYQK